MEQKIATLPALVTTDSAQGQYMRHRMVRRLQEKTHYLAVASMFCGLWGFPGYSLNVDHLLWFSQLFTYLIFVLVSYTLLLENGRQNLAMLTLIAVVVVLYAEQFTPAAYAFEQLSQVLHQHVVSSVMLDHASSEYTASALLAALIAASYLLQRGQWFMTSQALLCLAVLIPFVPLLGLMFGIYQPYGSMSLLATYSGLLCAAGLLTRQASHPPLSYLLMMDDTGKRIRLSILFFSMGAIVLTASTLRIDPELRLLPLILVLAMVIIVYILAVTQYQTANGVHEKILPPAQMEFASQVEAALVNQEFHLVYQPQIDFNTGRLKGLEVLIRWLRKGHGIASPSQFVHIAELTGLIVPLGMWTLRSACQQAALWRDLPVLGQVELSVNVSPMQLKTTTFWTDVQEILTETGFPPERLVLEITESALLEDDGETVAILQRLKQMGIKLAIDDFGTGYSCLAYLRDLPADYLKVDRSFVTELPGHNKAEAVIRGIVSLGKSLNYKIIAEGVENQAQAEYLKSLACDYVQGFMYGLPMVPSALQTWVQDHYPVKPDISNSTQA